MIHARKDYNRFQDPALHDSSLLGEGGTAIAEDEPVLLFRAQDKHFEGVIRAYLAMIQEDRECHSRETICDLLSDHIDRARAWQQANRVKSPDVPSELAGHPTN